MSTFPQVVRDATKLFAVWPALDDETLRRFALEVHKYKMDATEIQSLREATGVSNGKFRDIGRHIVEWVIATQLSRVGYNSRSVEQLVHSATETVQQMIGGVVSPMLVAEWVQDYYEEMSIFAKQPIRYRMLAAEKAIQLQEEMKCQSLPTISLRG